MTRHLPNFCFSVTLVATLAGGAIPAAAQDVDVESTLAPTELPFEEVAPIECPPPAEELPPEEFVMPTTGFVFTLPPDDAEAPGEECIDPGPPPPVRPPPPSLFRMKALPVGQISQLEKWEAVREAALAETPGPWDEFLSQAETVEQGNPVEVVNRWVNWRIRYVDDRRGDEWASAPLTLRRGFGDCEDFVIAKMALLEALGYAADDMYMVLLRDRRQVEHAVLAINREGRFYVLDNRTDQVLPAEQIDDYTPIVSYSGPFAWTYGLPPS